VLAEEEYAICDLRVDDHLAPIAELRRVLDVFKANAAISLRTRPRRDDYTPMWEAIVKVRDIMAEDLDKKQPVQGAEAKA
jgi:uncharacterized Ntn-hydrolase superfamily protein